MKQEAQNLSKTIENRNLSGEITGSPVKKVRFSGRKGVAKRAALTFVMLLAASLLIDTVAQDTTPPVVNTKTFTLLLDINGTATLLPEDVDNGSNDESGPVTLSVAPNFFTCSDLGPQTVTLTATDQAGNSASADVVIMVVTSLNINSISLNNCELAVPYALFIPDVSGGDGSYSYYWEGLEPGSKPFLEVLPFPPYLVFSNTSTYETPFYNNLLPDGIYNIRLVVTDGNGCVDTSVMVMNKSGVVFDNITLRYSEACEGEVKTYFANTDSLVTYNWTVENGTILNSDLDTNMIDVQWDTGINQGVVVATLVKVNLVGDTCTSFIVDTVAVNPVPVPVFDNPATVACIASEVTYKLTDTYSTYAWSVTGGFIVAGGTQGSDFATIRWGGGPDGRVLVSVSNEHSCSGSVFVDVYVYNNTITLTSAPETENQSLCINTGLTNITYATTGATGATFTGLPAGVTGLWAADAVTISGTPSESGIFNYTVTLTGGCGVITANGIINVTPDNTITLISPAGSDNLSACINESSAEIVYATTGATGATVSGLPAGITGSWLADTLIIAGVPTELGIFGYTVNLTGGCGVVTATGTITVLPESTISITSAPGTDNQTLCMNSALTDITYATTGATGATASGLPSGVTAVWAANVVTISGTPLESGAFNYIVTLTGGCGTITATGVITVNPVPVLIITNPNPVCPPATFDLTDPTITAGSTPGITLTYWTDEFATLPYATPETAAAGVYYIKGETPEGCFTISPVTAIYGTPPVISAVVTDVLCHGEASGTIDISLTGGAAPFTFLWSNGAATEDLSGLSAGIYSVVVTDAYGCVASEGYTINEPATPLTVSIISQTNVLCFGQATGSATAEASGGTAPYSYSWDSDPVQTAALAENLAAGVYTVTVTDANGCTATSTVTITQPPVGITVNITSTDVLCFGEANGTATAEASGGTAPYSYSWNTTPEQTAATATGLAAGSYTVTVTDADGCTATGTVMIVEPLALVLSASSTDASCPDVTDATIDLTISGGTSPYSVIWNDGSTSEDRTSVTNGTYTVVVTDANGCSANLTVVVGFSGIGCLEIPDVFTPNDDGKNDVWRIRYIELYPDAELTVFNRWGRRIYQTRNAGANPWDGKLRGRPLPTDSYHYILDLKDGSSPRTGVITIVR